MPAGRLGVCATHTERKSAGRVGSEFRVRRAEAVQRRAVVGALALARLVLQRNLRRRGRRWGPTVCVVGGMAHAAGWPRAWAQACRRFVLVVFWPS